MQLCYKNFKRNSLRCAAAPTPEQPDYVGWTNPDFKRMARQNPSVLQPLETVCSARKHPLSSVSGRRRYNTLDFPTENRVPTGCFHPYWKPRSKGTCSSFTIPAVLKSVYTNRKNGVCIYTSQNTKIPRAFLRKEDEFSGDFLYAAFIEAGEIHASHTAAAMRVFKILIRILVRESYMCPHRLHIHVPVLAATGSGSCLHWRIGIP